MCKEQQGTADNQGAKAQCRMGLDAGYNPQAQYNSVSQSKIYMLLTMLMEPSTARPMPKNFCTDPDSSWRQTANIAVKTGMVGCMQVATKTPDNEMPKMYINWLKNKQTPRATT